MESVRFIFHKPENQKMDLHRYLISLHHTQQSIKSYEFVIRRFLRDNPQANEYTYRQVFDYVKKRILSHPERQSLSLLQAGIKKYYDFLIQTGIRESHPCAALFLKQKRKPIVHYDLFSPVELEPLLRRQERYGMLKLRNRIIISLLIFQGLTMAEILKLKIKQINFEEGTIQIRKSQTLNARKLDLSQRQQVWIDLYLKRDRPKLDNSKWPTDILLLNKLGRPISSDVIQYLVETHRVIFPGRKLSAATIRQSVIANWLNNYHIPLEQVQILAGHKCMSTTLRYRQEDMKRKVELMNRFFPVEL